VLFAGALAEVLSNIFAWIKGKFKLTQVALQGVIQGVTAL